MVPLATFVTTVWCFGHETITQVRSCSFLTRCKSYSNQTTHSTLRYGQTQTLIVITPPLMSRSLAHARASVAQISYAITLPCLVLVHLHGMDWTAPGFQLWWWTSLFRYVAFLLLWLTKLSQFIINGSAEFTELTVSIDSTGTFPVSVLGELVLNDTTLLVQLSSPLPDQSVIPIITAEQITGNFSTIQVLDDPSRRKCERLSSYDLRQSETSVSVLLYVSLILLWRTYSWIIADLSTFGSHSTEMMLCLAWYFKSLSTCYLVWMGRRSSRDNILHPKEGAAFRIGKVEPILSFETGAGQPPPHVRSCFKSRSVARRTASPRSRAWPSTSSFKWGCFARVARKRLSRPSYATDLKAQRRCVTGTGAAPNRRRTLRVLSRCGIRSARRMKEQLLVRKRMDVKQLLN